MPYYVNTVFQGHDIALFLPDHDWGYSLSIKHRLESYVDTGRTGREERRLRYRAIRREVQATFMLSQDEAAELQVALHGLGKAYIGLPLFPDNLPVSRWSERICEPLYVINYDPSGYQIYAADALPAEPAYAFYAPLLVGRRVERPKITPLDVANCRFALRVIERSPWGYRIGIAPEGVVAANWPATLEANWRQLPEDGTEDTIEYQDVGDGRIEGIDGDEGEMYRTQRMLVTCGSRAEIRTLLNFWVARKGRVQSFDAPWLHQPGDDTIESPHTATARFASDELELSFKTDETADATIQLQQVPWEEGDGIEGEVPVQDDDAYLYRFTLKAPVDPVIYRFTSWEYDLTRAGDGTYKGDSQGLFEHDKIEHSIDLGDDPATLASWVFAGNPLLLIVQRALDVPLGIEIFKCNPDDPAAAELVYSGEVGPTESDSSRLEAETTVLGGLLEQKVPNFFFGPRCNYRFCGPGCTLDPEDWTFLGTLSSSAGGDVVVDVDTNPPGADLVDDYFARAWISKGSGEDFEIRKIVRSYKTGAAQQRFTLKRPFRNLTASEAMTFRVHCTGTRMECRVKFGNYINFGGHFDIGPRNLSVPTREADTPTAKK